MKRRTLAYFVVLGIACAGAVVLRAPYLPLAAFAVLETVLTYLERAAERRARPAETRRHARVRTPRA
jgi:hypothetical protein